MKVCEFPKCRQEAQFLMGWDNKNGKHFGHVCTTHDKKLGRTNLAKVGVSLEDAILFERYTKLTVDLDVYPDFPAWLVRRSLGVKPARVRPTSPTETHPVTTLNLLSHRAHNALRRHGITTIEELASVSDYELSRVPGLGPKSINEIREQLSKLGHGHNE